MKRIQSNIVNVGFTIMNDPLGGKDGQGLSKKAKAQGLRDISPTARAGQDRAAFRYPAVRELVQKLLLKVQEGYNRFINPIAVGPLSKRVDLRQQIVLAVPACPSRGVNASMYRGTILRPVRERNDCPSIRHTPVPDIPFALIKSRVQSDLDRGKARVEFIKNPDSTLAVPNP